MFPAITMPFSSSPASLSCDGIFLRFDLRQQGRVWTARQAAPTLSTQDVGQKNQRQGDHHQDAKHEYRFITRTRQTTLGRPLFGRPTDITLR